MSDPQDRRMADQFETELRRKTELDPSNGWELVWFLQLPLETRCSYMRILEARIDQDATRQFLFRQSCYRQNNWRNPVTDCMIINASVSSRPWASLGKRQNRKSHEYGRMRVGRPRKPRRPRSTAIPAQPPAPPAAPIVPTLPPMSPSVSDVTPPRPSTPAGLREAVRSDEPLHAFAQGHNPYTLDNQIFSPRSLITPPEPVQYPPYPLHIRPKGMLVAPDGRQVPRVFAYWIAAGRHLVAPWRVHTLQEAANDMLELDAVTPKILLSLAKVLCPSGLGNLHDAAHPHASVIVDFVRGWSVVTEACLTGRMPDPARSQCVCGGN
ncbi:hypothetical protein FRC12_025156 [Ceratobasidium sp. 428]|nr:hypothetical protein FRC12_025156 [Ceratobasidium sp. 428]